MSTDFSIRPVGIPAPAPIVTTSNSAANDAVQTDLPASQTVAASNASAAVRNDLRNNENISRQVVFDQAAASFVFQVVNDKTDSVVTQFPDEAILRRRAYFHALDLSKSELSRPLSTDRSA
jgi:FlaG protein.